MLFKNFNLLCFLAAGEISDLVIFLLYEYRLQVIFVEKNNAKLERQADATDHGNFAERIALEEDGVENKQQYKESYQVGKNIHRYQLRNATKAFQCIGEDDLDGAYYQHGCIQDDQGSNIEHVCCYHNYQQTVNERGDRYIINVFPEKKLMHMPCSSHQLLNGSTGILHTSSSENPVSQQKLLIKPLVISFFIYWCSANNG